MSNKLLFTYWIGQRPLWLSDSVKNMKQYAERIGADFHLYTTPFVKAEHVNFESMRVIYDWAMDDYDKVCVLDADMLISPTAPSIFDIEIKDLAATNPGLSPSREGIRELVHKYYADTKGSWYGGGTVVWSREGRLKARDKWDTVQSWIDIRKQYKGPGTLMEQPYLNAMIAKNHADTITEISRSWNVGPTEQVDFPKHIVHFTGGKKRMIPQWRFDG